MRVRFSTAGIRGRALEYGLLGSLFALASAVALLSLS